MEHLWGISNIETSEQKSTVFVTRFETSDDGIKSTTSKIADVDGVLIEEVLSEPEQEKEKPQGDVVIEEVQEEGENLIFHNILNQFQPFSNAKLQENSCLLILSQYLEIK